jgi:hypothetical protein
MRKFALVFAALIATSSASAQAPVCTQPERAQFDFWVGEWDVQVKGQSRAVNRIERTHGGCVVTENYRTNDGKYSGSSINLYLTGRKRWVQRWADSGGLLLELEGGLENGAMRMQSQPSEGQIERITWTRIDDDHVTQLWEKSGDNGRSWTTAFDGLYVRKKKA